MTCISNTSVAHLVCAVVKSDTVRTCILTLAQISGVPSVCITCSALSCIFSNNAANCSSLKQADNPRPKSATKSATSTLHPTKATHYGYKCKPVALRHQPHLCRNNEMPAGTNKPHGKRKYHSAASYRSSWSMNTSAGTTAMRTACSSTVENVS